MKLNKPDVFMVILTKKKKDNESHVDDLSVFWGLEQRDGYWLQCFIIQGKDFTGLHPLEVSDNQKRGWIN